MAKYFVPQDNQINQDPNCSPGDASFEDELPLLVELGINFEHIKMKTLSVLNPFKKLDPSVINDNDITGPVIYALILGFMLLLVCLSM